MILDLELVTKLFSLFNFKMVLEQNLSISEHGYADRVNICNYTFMIFTFA